ncbi:MAG: sigma-70 family RNA polymerase sigma factor [Flavobacteriaceae bacterium]|nr:sigma-70 family RNA polymerase sigma factor [Flavobacteriaceae bacterium]
MSNKIKHTLDSSKWVDLHSDYMYNYTITRVNDHEIAKDLVQETFFSSLKAMKNFKGEASERTWLISILKRKIIDYYRKKNSKKGQAEVRMNFYEDDRKGKWLEERAPTVWGNAGEKNMENNELKSALEKCIANLSEKYRLVFLLKTVQNYESEEICNELDITSSNLWVIIHRARVQLKNCLERTWFNS